MKPSLHLIEVKEVDLRKAIGWIPILFLLGIAALGAWLGFSASQWFSSSGGGWQGIIIGGDSGPDIVSMMFLMMMFFGGLIILLMLLRRRQ